MTQIALQLAAALLAAARQAAPPAGTDPMAGFYGNTVTLDVPAAFYHARRFIDPDGTWREPRGSGWIRGAWRIEGDQNCNWQTEPKVHEPRRYCYPITPRKVGERWETVDPETGNVVYQAITPDRN